MSTTVFLVDDHEIVRRGIADMIEAESDLEVVGDAASVAEALVGVRTVKPDVAVLDVRLPDGNGVELCRELRSRQPELRCLILTSFADEEAMFGAIMAGAAGFVLKEVVGSDLVKAIRDVGSGQSLLDGKLSAPLLNRMRRRQERVDPLDTLTDRERRVLELIVEGLTNWEIAIRMALSETTVKNYVSRLLEKLSMRNRVQAAVFAMALRSNRDSADR